MFFIWMTPGASAAASERGRGGGIVRRRGGALRCGGTTDESRWNRLVVARVVEGVDVGGERVHQSAIRSAERGDGLGDQIGGRRCRSEQARVADSDQRVTRQ